MQVVFEQFGDLVIIKIIQTKEINHAGNVILFIDLFFKLSSQCVWDSALDPGDTAVNVVDKDPSVKEFIFQGGHWNINKYIH